MSPLRFLHATAFVVPFTVFTVLLLIPHPNPVKIEIHWLAYLVQKSAHLCGYAYLAAVGYLFPKIVRYRWGVILFLMLHGIGTEIGQTYVPGRSGQVKDVLIDWCGITVGLLAARRFSRPRSPENRIPTDPEGSQFPAERPE
ncbi:MAG TPA: VanZ family protein [Fimbriiglobus sp.]|jgi:VanZ family protein